MILILLLKGMNVVNNVYQFVRHVRSLNDPLLQTHQQDFVEINRNGRTYIEYEPDDDNNRTGKPM